MLNPLTYSCHLLPSMISEGWDSELLLSVQCLSIVTHAIDCFLPNLHSTKLKSFLTPKAFPVTGDGVTFNMVTSPYPSNPMFLTSGPGVLPRFPYNDFYIEMQLYLLSVVKCLGLLLSHRKGERIDFSCSQPYLF